MNYDFDKPVDRRNTDSRKFDTKSLNNIPEDATPLWIADMDFETAPCITHAFTSRTIRKTFNTALAPLSLHNLSPFAIDLVVAGYNEGDEWVDGLVSYIEGNKILIENFFKEHRLGLNVIQSEGTLPSLD